MTHAPTADAAPEPIDITIGSGDDVAAALRHPESRVRIAILRDVVANPEKLARFGGAGDRDLVDELLLLCQETSRSPDRDTYAYALLHLRDPRVAAFAAEEFVHGHHGKLALLAASRVAELPAHERVSLLTAVVMDHATPARARAAANLLADVDALSPRLRLRVALLSDHDVEPPPLDDTTFDVWRDALQGDRPASARSQLTRLGPDALALLLTRWADLSEDTGRWVLERAQTDLASAPTHLLRPALAAATQALASDTSTRTHRCTRTLLAALRLASTLFATSDDTERLEAAVRRLDTHPSRRIRAAAMAVGHDRPDPLNELDRELDPIVRASLLTSLTHDPRHAATTALTQALGDPDWQARSAAASALVRRHQASADSANADALDGAPSPALHALRRAFDEGGEVAQIAAGRALREIADADPFEAQRLDNGASP